MKKSTACLLFAICSFFYSYSEASDQTVTGIIVNAVTREPLADAIVSIIETADTTLTNEEGIFTIIISDSLVFNSEPAISVKKAEFWSRELNVSVNSMDTIEIAPLNYDTYIYNKPVQLNDDIVSGTLTDAYLDKDNIQELMDKFVQNGFSEIHSILVYKKQNLALEQYFFGNNDSIQFENNIFRDSSPEPIWWERTTKHYVASVNKSLTSTITGIVLEAYGKSVNDSISTFLPDYAQFFSDSNKAAVTIHHALSMTMGFQWDEWTGSDLSTLWRINDFTAYLLLKKNMGVASEWRYNSAAPNMLLNCMNNIVMGSIRDWADQNFYKKLGITDYLWQNQPRGLPEGAARMYLRPRDMLKIGITYLNNGIWLGEQVISPDWVNAVSKDQVSVEGVDNYGYYFWLRSVSGINYYAAEGDGGNYIIIIPSLDMVVVMTGGNYLDFGVYQSQMLVILRDYLIPAVIPTSIETNKNTIYNFDLYSNYPNPFNPNTTIRYQLKTKSKIQLTIYDLSGRKIKTLIDKHQNAGEHSVNFNASGLASGVYIYRLKTSTGFVLSRKMLLLR